MREKITNISHIVSFNLTSRAYQFLSICLSIPFLPSSFFYLLKPIFSFFQVRLSWHDAGTYDAATNTGGPTAAMRFAPVSLHGANNGLVKFHTIFASF